MQQHSLDDDILYQLRRILSFQFLSRNYFLLRKFDPNTGCINLQCLAKEKSFRQLVDYPYGIETIANILIQYNYTNWIFDQTFHVIRPIFEKERKQVQILIKKNNVDEFKIFLEEFDIVKEYEVQEAEYIANKDMIKIFIIFENEDDAQISFSKIQQCKALFAIQNAKMEEVDYFQKFLNIVQSKQQQFQDYRMNNHKNYQNNQIDDQQFQQYSQAQQQNQQFQNQKLYENDKQFKQDYSSSDIVNQRLNQIRSNEKIELNYAPVQEQQSMFSFVPFLNSTQSITNQITQDIPKFIEKNNSIDKIQDERNTENMKQSEYIEYQTNQIQILSETESNKENSLERNNKQTHQKELYQQKQYMDQGYQKNGYQKRRNNYGNNQNRQNNNKNNRKQQYYSNYNRLEDDLREFTGFKKYQQRQQKEYFELKKEY
ncbi:unnamed protein product [Paramecium sonneborni]|uniref:Uncharacterized protein n=1 Tax=Paramecium sonneborni TaxID=65129 RepID=A0A8S1PT06_9CILI|nr:unnamed protein product [Paramecium sonneborni]